LNSALELEPNNVTALTNRGNYWNKTNNFGRALMDNLSEHEAKRLSGQVPSLLSFCKVAVVKNSEGISSKGVIFKNKNLLAELNKVRKVLTELNITPESLNTWRVENYMLPATHSIFTQMDQIQFPVVF
jgi:hypothetical protein